VGKDLPGTRPQWQNGSQTSLDTQKKRRSSSGGSGPYLVTSTILEAQLGCGVSLKAANGYANGTRSWLCEYCKTYNLYRDIL
jgi:hypothetical protein